MHDSSNIYKRRTLQEELLYIPRAIQSTFSCVIMFFFLRGIV